jgi:hypothetical protein
MCYKTGQIISSLQMSELSLTEGPLSPIIAKSSAAIGWYAACHYNRCTSAVTSTYPKVFDTACPYILKSIFSSSIVPAIHTTIVFFLIFLWVNSPQLAAGRFIKIFRTCQLHKIYLKEHVWLRINAKAPVWQQT